MRMKIIRWTAGITMACAAVAVLLLPIPGSSRPDWRSTEPDAVATAVARSWAVRMRLDDAVRSYRSWSGVARWRLAAAKGGAVVIDESVPLERREALRRAAESEWARIGPEASSERATVFIYADTTSLRRAVAPPAGSQRLPALEPNRPADVVYALPSATDGSTCVVLVRLRNPSATDASWGGAGSLMGPCAFYAAFGAPGAGLERWLDRTGFAVARRADWDTPRAPPLDASGLYALPEAASRCLTSGGAACLALVGLGSAATVSRQRDDRPGTMLLDDRGVIPRSFGPHRARALGEAESRFLADLAREAGKSRFKAFWKSAERPEAAFAGSIGRPLEDWTRDWLGRTYGAPGGRRGVTTADIVWLAIAFPLCVVAATRPRERVLGTGRRGAALAS